MALNNKYHVTISVGQNLGVAQLGPVFLSSRSCGQCVGWGCGHLKAWLGLW